MEKPEGTLQKNLHSTYVGIKSPLPCPTDWVTKLGKPISHHHNIAKMPISAILYTIGISALFMLVQFRTSNNLLKHLTVIITPWIDIIARQLKKVTMHFR
jgi:hypothetical protein